MHIRRAQILHDDMPQSKRLSDSQAKCQSANYLRVLTNDKFLSLLKQSHKISKLIPSDIWGLMFSRSPHFNLKLNLEFLQLTEAKLLLCSVANPKIYQKFKTFPAARLHIDNSYKWNARCLPFWFQISRNEILDGTIALVGNINCPYLL